MNQRKMVAGLRHEHMGLKDAEFFAHIDANGGWPLGYRFVGFVHSDGREAGFCNSPNNDGWWTVIASADDYYLWKLSPEALQRIADAAWKSIYLPRVELSRMRIKNSRGWEAACAAGVAACQPPAEKITIRYERAGRCFWHIGCTAQHHAPPMRIGQDDAEKRRTAIHCTACNEAGYYPHGSVGEVCCERVTNGVGLAQQSREKNDGR